jgi:hypothetical protein
VLKNSCRGITGSGADFFRPFHLNRPDTIYIMKKFFQFKQLHPDFFMDNCTMLINPA